MSKLEFMADLWDFMMLRNKWWITPIILFLNIFEVIILLIEGSAIAPFIYTIF